MSIPGLGQIPTELPETSSNRTVTLHPYWEWRFEVPPGGTVSVRVLSGTAEKDGIELAPRTTYTFPSLKSRILTWHGCELEIEGRLDAQSVAEYTSSTNPATAYLNLHAHLEGLRTTAAREQREGPRVLIAGAPASGKTTLARTIASYATRLGRQPLVVNVSPRDAMLSLPGTLSAAVLATVLDPQASDGWGETPTSGPSPVPVKLPMVYYYGRETAAEEPEVYRSLVSSLAGVTSGRLMEDAEVKASGVIVDGMGCDDGAVVGVDLLAHLVDEFSINIIIVLGSEFLDAELTKRFANGKTSLGEPIDVVHLERPDGVAAKSPTFEQHARESIIKDYFFGVARRTLSPQAQQVDFDKITVYKLADDTSYGQDSITKVQPTLEMQHCTLAVMYASARDSHETIRGAGVMGFVYVADVDEEKRKIKLLAPVGGRLGDRPLIWGHWPDPFINLLG